MMQEAAWRHAETLGLGFGHMRDENRLWVLSRLRLSIYRPPEWGEEFILETWPSGVHRLLVSRDFRITDDDGVAAEASSSWIILDLDKRRPVRPQIALIEHQEMQHGELVFGGTAGKVELQGENDDEDSPDWNRSRPFVVRVSALDSQGHVNNAKYLEWCLDAFSLDHFNRWEIGEITMNFLAETHYDAELHVLTRQSSDSGAGTIDEASSTVETVQAVQTSDGEFVFACRTRWQR